MISFFQLFFIPHMISVGNEENTAWRELAYVCVQLCIFIDWNNITSKGHLSRFTQRVFVGLGDYKRFLNSLRGYLIYVSWGFFLSSYSKVSCSHTIHGGATDRDEKKTLRFQCRTKKEKGIVNFAGSLLLVFFPNFVIGKSVCFIRLTHLDSPFIVLHVSLMFYTHRRSSWFVLA